MPLYRQGLAWAVNRVTCKGVITACQGTALIFLPGRVVSLLAAIKLLNPGKLHEYGGLFSFLSILVWSLVKNVRSLFEAAARQLYAGSFDLFIS